MTTSPDEVNLFGSSPSDPDAGDAATDQESEGNSVVSVPIDPSLSNPQPRSSASPLSALLNPDNNIAQQADGGTVQGMDDSFGGHGEFFEFNRVGNTLAEFQAEPTFETNEGNFISPVNGQNPMPVNGQTYMPANGGGIQLPGVDHFITLPPTSMNGDQGQNYYQTAPPVGTEAILQRLNDMQRWMDERQAASDQRHAASDERQTALETMLADRMGAIQEVLDRHEMVLGVAQSHDTNNQWQPGNNQLPYDENEDIYGDDTAAQPSPPAPQPIQAAVSNLLFPSQNPAPPQLPVQAVGSNLLLPNPSLTHPPPSQRPPRVMGSNLLLPTPQAQNTSRSSTSQANSSGNGRMPLPSAPYLPAVQAPGVPITLQDTSFAVPEGQMGEVYAGVWPSQLQDPRIPRSPQPIRPRRGRKKRNEPDTPPPININREIFVANLQSNLRALPIDPTADKTECRHVDDKKHPKNLNKGESTIGDGWPYQFERFNHNKKLLKPEVKVPRHDQDYIGAALRDKTAAAHGERLILNASLDNALLGNVLSRYHMDADLCTFPDEREGHVRDTSFPLAIGDPKFEGYAQLLLDAMTDWSCYAEWLTSFSTGITSKIANNGKTRQFYQDINTKFRAYEAGLMSANKKGTHVKPLEKLCCPETDEQKEALSLISLAERQQDIIGIQLTLLAASHTARRLVQTAMEAQSGRFMSLPWASLAWESQPNFHQRIMAMAYGLRHVKKIVKDILSGDDAIRKFAYAPREAIQEKCQNKSSNAIKAQVTAEGKELVRKAKAKEAEQNNEQYPALPSAEAVDVEQGAPMGGQEEFNVELDDEVINLEDDEEEEEALEDDQEQDVSMYVQTQKQPVQPAGPPRRSTRKRPAPTEPNPPPAQKRPRRNPRRPVAAAETDTDLDALLEFNDNN